ncbi:CheR family methyltransferase [Lyngbya aestuarii]|uniref:CheR family methyltransferase n=1 Tax=Lyngbya aestuarii TaxID=118322 RepID=UPI00403DB93F
MSNKEYLNLWLTQAFTKLIAQHTGLAIRERDQTVLSEKIFLRMKSIKLDFPEEYYELLETKSAESYQEWQNLVILLTNIESYFFRDKGQLNLLQHRLLPEIIKRCAESKTIRICSAGCSSGEEPYSLAILLKEMIPNLKQWNISILGIDLNKVALEKAKKGIYTAWSFRSVDAEIKQRYFQFTSNQYELDPEIKQMVKFQPFNLVKEPFPHPACELRDMDLIVCRNVFIYFEESAITHVLGKFYHALQPSGYLLTGHAELYGRNLSEFQTKVFPESLVYQR